MTEHEKRQLKKRIARFVIAATILPLLPPLLLIFAVLDYAKFGRLVETVEVWEMVKAGLFFGKIKSQD